MRIGSFGYLMKQGWKSMAANRLMTFASIGVLTACMIITGIASLLSLSINRIVDYFGNQNEIVVYVRDDISENDVAALGNEISALDNVIDNKFVSKADAFGEMQEWLEDYSSLLEGLENIFPASYRVSVGDLELMEQTNTQIRLMSGVDETVAPSELAGIMISIQRGVTYGGWALVLVLGFVSVIVISNTIRLTVFARRREISIMKYVGATNAFIRMPFFIEGMTVGVISGGLATGVISVAYHFVYKWMYESGDFLVASIISSLYKLEDIWQPMLVLFIAFGVLIGGLGSATSIRKHLKV